MGTDDRFAIHSDDSLTTVPNAVEGVPQPSEFPLDLLIPNLVRAL
jgi:hypothetical protein